jgi:two-component system cell cycle sensor histidine kinase/response regulator CckA
MTPEHAPLIAPEEIFAARILIVDDLEANILLLEQILGQAGYTNVSSTRGPFPVRELHRKNRYDLILLDLQMPGQDGFEVMESLKQIETGAYLPVIVVTAQPDQRIRALKAGAKDFISKPFDIAELLFRVRNMLETRMLHAKLTGQDAAGRKDAEEALRRSEERFKLAARAHNEIVWDWNLLDQTLWWSEGFLASFGFDAHEIEPSIASWTDHIHPAERAEVMDGIRATAAAGMETWNADYRFRRKDGDYAMVADRAFILRDAGGKPVRIVGGMRDITAQKKAEAQKLHTERMESIGTLAAGIAHDLNNVLTPIILSAERLKRRIEGDARNSRTLDLIFTSAKRGAELVRQVLSLTGGLEGKRVALRLHSLFDDLDAFIRATFPQAITLKTEMSPDLWPVLGDPTQFHQVLLNLAVNARDAMPRGGTLTLSATNIAIDAQYARTAHQDAKTGPYVMLQVSDTGAGIPPAILERIFEPFFTTKDAHGTGIGLATAHAVVKKHGGFISVSTEIGRGSAFAVYLPADPSLQPAAAAVTAAEIPKGRNELVLVVDDEASIREITGQTLEDYGYRVLTARDGTEALALHAERHGEIAVVITDMMMPVMDGAATIEALLRVDPAVRVIAASGLDITGNLDKARRGGVTDFLTKPYTAETFLRLVREVLDRPARA